QTPKLLDDPELYDAGAKPDTDLVFLFRLDKQDCLESNDLCIVLALDLKKARSPGHGRSPVQLQARIGQKPEHP
ncbi:hypothetical protein AX14_007444, partial [Amanita brunnescens Koide BX004]